MFVLSSVTGCAEPPVPALSQPRGSARAGGAVPGPDRGRALCARAAAAAGPRAAAVHAAGHGQGGRGDQARRCRIRSRARRRAH